MIFTENTVKTNYEKIMTCNDKRPPFLLGVGGPGFLYVVCPTSFFGREAFSSSILVAPN